MKRTNVFISLLIFGGFFMGCREDRKTINQIPTAQIEFKKEGDAYLIKRPGDTLQHLQIEIADDDYQRETGLMYRDNLEENQGMLFIFEDEQPRGFYMKNTKIPLDLIFLDSARVIVNISKNAKPNSLETIESQVPAQFVLEVNAGLAQRWNLKVGDRLIFNQE